MPDVCTTFPEGSAVPINPHLRNSGVAPLNQEISFPILLAWNFDSFRRNFQIQAHRFLAFLQFPVSETSPKVGPPLCPISNFQSTFRNLTFGLFFSYLMN